MVPPRHYCIPPLSRINLERVLQLVEDMRYFTLRAPRQTGKTSTLKALADAVNDSGRYRCVYANFEVAQTARRAPRPDHVRAVRPAGRAGAQDAGRHIRRVGRLALAAPVPWRWRHPRHTALWAVLLFVTTGTLLVRAQTTPVDFAREVESTLRERCVACHGPSVQSGGLRLDTRANALKGGSSGPAIRPGDGDGSLLIQMLLRSPSEGPIMPLTGGRLPRSTVDRLIAWINEGAEWPEPSGQVQQASSSVHWSFAEPSRPSPPSVRDQSWPRNPIDWFVLARLEAEGLRPSGEAPPDVLLRRLSLDLTGLPPEPDRPGSLAAGAGTYHNAVDQMLSSPHYGEMRALHWLDQARFGESDGYQADYIRPYAWRWRHWVIDAFNRNLGFDRFTVEQIAGDLLPRSTMEQQVATGFHRNALHNREGGFPIEMDRVERNVERTGTVSTVWLGLTMGCARCHDHKFDPVSQADFYRLYAFLDRAAEVNIDAPMDGERQAYAGRRSAFERKRAELFERYRVPELQAYWETRILESATNPDSGLEPIWKILWDLLLFELDGGTETVRTPVQERTSKQSDLLARYFVLNVAGGYDFETPEEFRELEFDALKKEYRELEQEFPPLTQAYTMAANPDPPQTRILVRGNYRHPGEAVEPGAPAALHSLGTERRDRLGLARWLVSRRNPLTARVIANRVWQQHFGRGLVTTPDDFGTRGELPSHPALLDWLAVEFMESGWDVKRLHRLIVTSSTYRQSSNVLPELWTRDPDNRLLARQARFRLSAEVIRDAAFASAGLLDRRIGGESVRPYLPEGATEIGFGNFVKWPQSVGGDQYRRGLYIFRQRTLPYPQLETFDAPDSVQVVCQRDRSTTPLQALTLLNDPVFEEAARALAERVMREAGESRPDRVARLFQLCLGREPSPEESGRLLAYLDLQNSLRTAELEAQAGRGQEPSAADDSFAWTAVASVLLNLAEFLTRG